MYGTSVLGADIGGIPELIRPGTTGELFESGNLDALVQRIRALWEDASLCREYGENCRSLCFDTLKTYTDKLMPHYEA